MTRLTVFLSVLTAIILVLIQFNNRSLPVNNSKFDFAKTKEEFDTKAEAVHKAIEAQHESKDEVAEATTEVEIKVDLNTPQLVNGSKVFSKCIACHGKDGAGKPAQKAPHIGGQFDWYVEKQLTDMKSGARINEAMNPTLKGLTDQDIKDVAVYVSKLPWKKGEVAATPEKK